jgi:hypothetical protein
MKVLHKITVQLDNGPWTVFVYGPIQMSREFLLARLERKFPELSMELYGLVVSGQYADDKVETID